VRAAGLDRVTLLPRVPMLALPAHIARAHLCLGIFGETPKAARVVPNKVFQCMGVGRPVISADTPAMRELFTGGEEMVLVAPADAKALAAAIEAHAADRAARERIGSAAAERVRRDFSPVPLARRLVAYCAEAMA
jgi:glycosyltransferase involved in cell wall biosynthesis